MGTRVFAALAVVQAALIAATGAPETTPAASTSTTTPAPQIDLVTIGVGHAMYAVFGHAAIRVRYPDGRDVAYNYGGVDIEQDGFWFKLMQGRVDAYLEVTSYSDLLLKYSGEDRSIWGRKLALTDDQVRSMIAELEAMNTDATRYYRYHHIFDNCTTRAAELLDRTLQGTLSKQASTPVSGTHRDWILDRIRHEPGLFLVMDMAGNGQGDVPIMAWDTIFIPEAVDAIVDAAKNNGQPLVAEKYTDYVSQSVDPKTEWDWPWTKVYLLFLLPWMALAAWRPRPAALIYGLIGTAAGLAYTGFWLLSDYDFYHRNWNMLLFPPTHLWLVIAALVAKQWASFATRLYLRAHGAVILLVALGSMSGLVVQAITPMLVLAGAFTGLLIYKTRKS